MPDFQGSQSQLIPDDIKYDANATPPQYTDNGDQVIEKGTHLRIKIIGLRSDVGSMFAIGSIKEDFLGYAGPPPSILLLADKLAALSEWSLACSNTSAALWFRAISKGHRIKASCHSSRCCFLTKTGQKIVGEIS